MNNRRKHQPITPIVEPLKCSCGHKVDEHNQFGCCHVGNVCICLLAFGVEPEENAGLLQWMKESE